jgi:hypothetical protein
MPSWLVWLFSILILLLLGTYLFCIIYFSSISPWEWGNKYSAYKANKKPNVRCVNDYIKDNLVVGDKESGTKKFNQCLTYDICAGIPPAEGQTDLKDSDGKTISQSGPGSICSNAPFCEFDSKNGICTPKACSVYTEQTECENSGCGWADGKCSGTVVCTEETRDRIKELRKKAESDEKLCPHEYHGPGLRYERGSFLKGYEEDLK